MWNGSVNAAASTSSSSGGRVEHAVDPGQRVVGDAAERLDRAWPPPGVPTHSSPPSPAASTTPHTSMPMVNGTWPITLATVPRQRAMSPKLSDAADTVTRTSPGPGLGHRDVLELQRLQRRGVLDDSDCSHLCSPSPSTPRRPRSVLITLAYVKRRAASARSVVARDRTTPGRCPWSSARRSAMATRDSVGGRPRNREERSREPRRRVRDRRAEAAAPPTGIWGTVGQPGRWCRPVAPPSGRN